MKKIKTILWATWKDIYNPKKGGAELVNNEIAIELRKYNYKVYFITPRFKNSKKIERINNYIVIRIGNKYNSYILIPLYYFFYLRNKYDIIIDQCNTLPYFLIFFKGREKLYFLIQQLCKEVWFYQAKFPISLIGYFIENSILKLYNKCKTITFAKTTKNDLINLNFVEKNIIIINEHHYLNEYILKEKKIDIDNLSILFFSALRPMKRVEEVIKAIYIVTKIYPNTKLNIAGDGDNSYKKKIKKLIKYLGIERNINFLGNITDDSSKKEIMMSSDLMCCTSAREGWGIIVSESGSMGTPAIVYNINGLVDAVNYGESGFRTDVNNPFYLAKKILEVAENEQLYSQIRSSAYYYSRKINTKETLNILLNFLNSEENY